VRLRHPAGTQDRDPDLCAAPDGVGAHLIYLATCRVGSDATRFRRVSPAWPDEVDQLGRGHWGLALLSIDGGGKTAVAVLEHLGEWRSVGPLERNVHGGVREIEVTHR